MKTITLTQDHTHAGIELKAGTTLQMSDADAEWLAANVPGTVVGSDDAPMAGGRRQSDRAAVPDVPAAV